MTLHWKGYENILCTFFPVSRHCHPRALSELSQHVDTHGNSKKNRTLTGMRKQNTDPISENRKRSNFFPYVLQSSHTDTFCEVAYRSLFVFALSAVRAGMSATVFLVDLTGHSENDSEHDGACHVLVQRSLFRIPHCSVVFAIPRAERLLNAGYAQA